MLPRMAALVLLPHVSGKLLLWVLANDARLRRPRLNQQANRYVGGTQTP
ncbi:hypothetical protein CAURIC_00085 [Corynebacterium auriscanis]|nr:hypothetical protein CAURIC_00085 [Corynebacterium auriscanis]